MLAPAGALKSEVDELAQGIDARGLHRYGLPLLAADTLVHFGSCTANPITPATVARHRELARRQPAFDPQAELRRLFGAAQCLLAASGTDAEYTCALAMGPGPYCSIVMDPNEIGGGALQAAAGLAHAQGCPVSAPLPLQAVVACTRMRDENGRALTQAAVDDQVFAILARHRGQPVLLHHVPCTKTGLSSPSEAACLQVQHGHAGGARIVVDASQGRCTAQDVRRWLGLGWAVILTGSKYLGAPPFCGATLLPEGWPRGTGFAVGPGVVARWRLAFDNLAFAPAGEAWTQALMAVFVPRLRRGWVDADAPGGRQGILSFDVGLDAAQTRRLHRRLIARGYFLGQPVTAGGRHLLRLAPAARTSLAGVADDLERLAGVIHDERTVG